MFDASDPRSRLQAGSAAVGAYAAADYIRIYEEDPTEVNESSRTWWTRGQNFYLAYSEVRAGALFVRDNQADEYVLILPDPSCQVEVRAGAESCLVDGYSLVMIPPGESTVHVRRGGRVVRLFSVANSELEGMPINRASYYKPHPNVAAFTPWPDPSDGFRIRAYSLEVPKQEGRFGRIWRCTTFMVNFLDPTIGPREPTKMSPHSHEDFEQCSLSLDGEFVHHLRWPWIPDMTQWREDDHETCGSPSVTIIPPPAVHTSQAIGAGINQLVDVFCPPRLDFSNQHGWVLNGDEYPML